MVCVLSEGAEKIGRGKMKEEEDGWRWIESSRVCWNEMWTGDLTRREGRWTTCRTGTEPKDEKVKGRY